VFADISRMGRSMQCGGARGIFRTQAPGGPSAAPFRRENRSAALVSQRRLRKAPRKGACVRGPSARSSHTSLPTENLLFEHVPFANLHHRENLLLGKTTYLSVREKKMFSKIFLTGYDALQDFFLPVKIL